MVKISVRYLWTMSIDYMRVNRIPVSAEREAQIISQLRARIEEYNRKDYQAVVRGRKERAKWLQTRNGIGEEAPSDN